MFQKYWLISATHRIEHKPSKENLFILADVHSVPELVGIVREDGNRVDGMSLIHIVERKNSDLRETGRATEDKATGNKTSILFCSNGTKLYRKQLTIQDPSQY